MVPGTLPVPNNSLVSTLLAEEMPDAHGERASDPHPRVLRASDFTCHPQPPCFTLRDKYQDDLILTAFTVYHRLCLVIPQPQSGANPHLLRSWHPQSKHSLNIVSGDQTSNVAAHVKCTDPSPRAAASPPARPKKMRVTQPRFLFPYSLSF